MRFPSSSTPGSIEGLLPVAIRMVLHSTSVSPLSLNSFTTPGRLIMAWPLYRITLFFALEPGIVKLLHPGPSIEFRPSPATHPRGGRKGGRFRYSLPGHYRAAPGACRECPHREHLSGRLNRSRSFETGLSGKTLLA